MEIEFAFVSATDGNDGDLHTLVASRNAFTIDLVALLSTPDTSAS